MYCTAPLSPRKGRLGSFRDDDDDDDDGLSRVLKSLSRLYCVLNYHHSKVMTNAVIKHMCVKIRSNLKCCHK